MNAVDTNVLIYAHDPRDPGKQQKAASIIASLTEGVLLWQVACEYLAASRKLVSFGLDINKAFADLKRLHSIWLFLPPNWNILETAEKLMETGNLSFWDAMIVSACKESGIQTLYSEDFDSSTTALNGVTIINPFK